MLGGVSFLVFLKSIGTMEDVYMSGTKMDVFYSRFGRGGFLGLSL